MIKSQCSSGRIDNHDDIHHDEEDDNSSATSPSHVFGNDMSDEDSSSGIEALYSSNVSTHSSTENNLDMNGTMNDKTSVTSHDGGMNCDGQFSSEPLLSNTTTTTTMSTSTTSLNSTTSSTSLLSTSPQLGTTINHHHKSLRSLPPIETRNLQQNLDRRATPIHQRRNFSLVRSTSGDISQPNVEQVVVEVVDDDSSASPLTMTTTTTIPNDDEHNSTTMEEIDPASSSTNQVVIVQQQIEESSHMTTSSSLTTTPTRGISSAETNSGVSPFLFPMLMFNREHISSPIAGGTTASQEEEDQTRDDGDHHLMDQQDEHSTLERDGDTIMLNVEEVPGSESNEDTELMDNLHYSNEREPITPSSTLEQQLSESTSINTTTTSNNNTTSHEHSLPDIPTLPLDLDSLIIHPPLSVPSFIDIPNHFLCPITKLIMHQPVKNMYGKTYERESIEQWWKTLHSNQQPLTDPLTNQKITDRTLTEDTELKTQIQEFLHANPHFRFSINDAYFPKQVIREMKVAIDNENLEGVRNLLAQFPCNFYAQTKFPLTQTQSRSSRIEKETSVSIFDCLYRRFKTVFDTKSDKEAVFMEEDFTQDSIIAFIVKQFKIVRDYCISRQKELSKAEGLEFHLMESNIKDGLKNIFVNSIRLFPSTSILDWFISLGASLSSSNQFKQNAFHMACMTDQLEIAQHLYHLNTEALKENPPTHNIIEEKLSDEVKKKWNAFYLAIWHNSQKIIDWIIEHPDLSSKLFSKSHRCMVKDKSSIYHPMNALSLAAYKKNIPLMEILITKFDFELDDHKCHPIYWSCIANDLNGFKWICDYMEANLTNGTQILKQKLNAVNDRAFKRTLIHAIAMEASDDMMEYFLKKCKELNILTDVVNMRDNFGNTALHYACEKSKTKTILNLIHEGIDYDYINKQGKTATQCCKTTEDRDVIQKAIRTEREMLKTKVKTLEDEVEFLKRKFFEMEEKLFNKKQKNE